jgi:hypothetical protein
MVGVSWVRWQKRQRELEAAYLVAAVLDGDAICRDKPGAPDGTHDFDVVLVDGSLVALEVTTAASSRILGTLAVLHKVSERRYPCLTMVWTITGTHPGDGESGPRIRELAGRVEGLLRRLEVADVDRFDDVSPVSRRDLGGDARQAMEELRALGVTSGRATSAPLGDVGSVSLGLVGGGGVLDPEALNVAVAREVDANLAKLDRAAADERHLFVWVDSTSFSAELSMWTLQVPPGVLELPSSISTVWAATWGPGVSYGSKAARLWRATPPAGWRVLEVPPIHVRGEQGPT